MFGPNGLSQARYTSQHTILMLFKLEDPIVGNEEYAYGVVTHSILKCVINQYVGQESGLLQLMQSTLSNNIDCSNSVLCSPLVD